MTDLSQLQPVKWKGVVSHQTPFDLFNYHDFVMDLRPAIVVEVGRGDGGTLEFLRDLGIALEVLSVDLDEPVPDVCDAMVFLDGDVYSADAMTQDLGVYVPRARQIVVCHTNRPDWGARPALDAWEWSEGWMEWTPKFPTQHSFFCRVVT